MRVSNNLTELDAKSAKELVEEGKKGISAEFLTASFPNQQSSRAQRQRQGMDAFLPCRIQIRSALISMCLSMTTIR